MADGDDNEGEAALIEDEAPEDSASASNVQLVTDQCLLLDWDSSMFMAQC